MRVTKIQPSERIKGRWLLYLEDGDILRVSEGEMVSFSIYAGMELTEELRQELTASARKSAAKSKAISYLASRPLSRKELVDKLTAQPRDREKEPLADEELALEIADRLEELGYLNDASYAATIVRHYGGKGYGERKVRDELYRRGIPRDLWDEAMEEKVDPEDGVDAFLQKKFRGKTPDEKERKRASDALARRGYSWSEISAGLRRYGEDIEEMTP